MTTADRPMGSTAAAHTQALAPRLTDSSAQALARAIRARQISSQEVVGAHLDRIAAVNPALNAVVHLAAEEARAQAAEADAALARGEWRGPLHGVPVTIKDAFDTAGLPSTGGVTGRAGAIPAQDATVVARLRRAGAIIMGKTNLPELSMGYETDNLIVGRTNNPYDQTRTPGGSSGGEAALIAAGASPLGLGTDFGGSLRVPSHFCGIATIKPTHGRVPLTGVFPPAVGTVGRLYHAGPLARSVDDLILALPILCGPDGADPAVVPMPLGDPRAVDLGSLRLALHTDNGVMAATPETARAVRAAATSLAQAGVAVEEARPTGIEQAYDLFRGLLAADGGASIEMLLQMTGTTRTHPLTQGLLHVLAANAMPTPQFGGLLVAWDLYRAGMLAFMESYDVLIGPVVALPAVPHGTSFADDTLPAFSYTMAHNLTGWPCAVVRAGTSPEGLPIGVQIVARPWREDVALAVARHVEAALGGWQRPPI